MTATDLQSMPSADLLALYRDVLVELAARAPDNTRWQACLTEAEQIIVTNLAGEREAAIARAKERERIAHEAKSRAAAEARESERRGAAEESVRKAMQAEQRQRALLQRAAELVDLSPADINIVRLGQRILVNQGDDYYTRDHLVDSRTSQTKLTRRLTKRRTEIVAWAAELRADTAIKGDRWCGADYDWEGTE